jgi:hypothetical protein
MTAGECSAQFIAPTQPLSICFFKGYCISNAKEADLVMDTIS